LDDLSQCIYIPLEHMFSLISSMTHFLNEKLSMLEGDKSS
jgi:hypothetical protein